MTTLVRVPDQFTEGAGVAAVHAAATPTCCCCCCCVGSVVTTSAVLAEGLRSDLRAAGRRNIVAVVLIALGPLIAVAPFIGLLAGGQRLGLMIETHFGTVELIAVPVGIAWTVAVAAASRVRRPLTSLRRFAVIGLFPIELFIGAGTVFVYEVLILALLPFVVLGVHRYYRDRDADRG